MKAKSKVYFSQEISPEKVLELYQALNIQLPGPVAVKVHSGEKGNQNFIGPTFWRPIVNAVAGRVVECNTAYGDANHNGIRDHTASHQQLLQEHGWTQYYDVDIMDAAGPDLLLPVPGDNILKTNLVGKHLADYSSMLVLAHFKGHPMGGYGGALKQLAIGCASRTGKALVHSAGRCADPIATWQQHATTLEFTEAMAGAAASVVRYFDGRLAFINVMKNLSVDCDCCSRAEDPCMTDIGILASCDPVAIDQAALDLVSASQDPGRDHFLERVNSRDGIHTIEVAAALNVGSRDYSLIHL